MRCVWSSGTQCLKLFKAIQHTNRMVNLRFSEDGLRVMSMDSSKTSLVQFLLEPGEFESFDCESPRVLGVYTEVLTNILSKAKKTKLVWSSANENILTIAFVDDASTTEFSIRTIDIEDDQLDIPELQDDVGMRVPYEVLHGWMDKVLMAKNDVHFHVTDKVFSCEAKSDEMGTIKHTEPIQSERIQMSTYKNTAALTLSYYATKSMAIFAATSASVVYLGLSNEQPSRIRVPIGDDSYLCLYVAPKIDDDM